MDTSNTTIDIDKQGFFMNKISLIIGIAMAFLLPIFIIPVNLISFVASKNIILFLGVILLFLMWIIDRIKNRDFFVSKNLLVISAYLIPLTYLLSAFFSGSKMAGLIGYGFETSSFAMILALFMLLFFTAKSFNSRRKVFFFYISLILSAFLMMLVHLLRLFLGPNFLSLGLLNSNISNLVGTWNELGVFLGLIVIITLIANEYLNKNKIIKITSLVLLIISLLFISLINFNLVWIFLMLISLFLVIYNFFLNKTENGFNFKKLYKNPSSYVFIITLLFILLPGQITGFLPQTFGISNIEVRPTISSTLDIGKSTLGTDLILGAGPSKFINQWILHKPQEIALTQFWNTDFNSGAGFILSSLATVGSVGFLAWLLFIGSILYLGFKLIKSSYYNKLDHFVILSLFSLSLYLILFFIFYVPGIVILGLTFSILGILIAFLKKENLIKVRRISFNQSKPRLIVFIILMVVILGTTAFGTFLFSKKVYASIQFNQASKAINIDQDFNKGYNSLVKAATVYPNDLYFRNLTDLNLIQLQNVFNQKDVSQEQLQEQFQAIFSATIGSAQQAILLDQSNYQNWNSLAKVYGAVAPLQIEGAYDKAFQAYSQAIRLNPKSPLLVLNLANLEITKGDLEKAKEYIGISIQMKQNYSNAYYLLSQLELNAGNKEQAIQIIEALASVSPNDPQVFLQLGALNYEERDYKKAQAFLERAVVLSPYYSDAKYLLALTYNEIGQRDKAIGQFQDLKILNPNDTNIDKILENIKEGRNPFAGFQQQTLPTPIEEEVEEESENEEEAEDGEETTEEELES